MSIDHTPFIKKYSTSESEPSADGTSPLLVLIAIILVLVAISLMDLFLYQAMLDMNMSRAWLAPIVAVSMLMALGICKLLNRFSPREKYFQILKEVIEGSRGARLVTNASNQTVHTNYNFDVFCKGEGKPSFETMLKVFGTNSEADSHLRALADEARRGLTAMMDIPVENHKSTFIYSVTAQPVPGWAGYIHWRIDDITETHLRRKAVQEEREKLIDFTDNAPVGFFSCDENGRFVFVNATFARWLGTNIENLIGTGSLHSYMKEPPKDEEPYDIITGGGARQVAEIKFKGPQGTDFLVSINQTVVQYDDGAVRTRAVISDIRAEREMERALQESRNRFRRFFEEAPLAIGFLTNDHIMTDCNEALAQIIKAPLKELRHRDFLHCVDKPNRHEFKGALERIVSGNDLANPLEINLIKHNSEDLVPVRVYAHKLKGGADIVLHFLDLTTQKELEQQFTQSQKMQAVGQLAGGVAHDFNNLLTAIIGFCDLLLLRHKPGDPSFQDIMQIQQNSNRAANLVRQLLAFSRQQTMRPQVQDVTDILTEISHLIRRLIGANIELDVVHGDDLSFVKVDANQMEQVFVNLAVNARDAMVDGGALVIKTCMTDTKKAKQCGEDTMPAGRWVQIDVTDTGTGIADDVLERIFEPFFTTKDVGQGTGLGLATVYGVVRQSNGYMNVDSKVGKGTTFSIYLPEAQEEDIEEAQTRVAETKEKESSDLTGTAHILLVEDEDAVRTFSKRALTNKGYVVTDANGGEQAMKVINDEKTNAIDLLITDVIMPDIDGPVLAKQIREKFPDLKIIFISGYTEEKLKDELNDDKTWFLPKPFTLTQLAAKVKDVLGS